MSSMERELELEDERVTERRYAEQLRKDERNRPRPRSWTGTKVPQLPDAVVGRFVGRVALRSPDELLGRRNDFYIGEKHTNVDGVEVYSWSAPIACSFYRKNHQHDAHTGLGELCADAVVIRSFRHVNGQIVEFADDSGLRRSTASVSQAGADNTHGPEACRSAPEAPSHYAPGSI